ncbi:MAG: TolC family protein [Candidatus Aminicenantes bacterium]|nr:TolC family protein [Candidatus Aminicenantes bacterium]
MCIILIFSLLFSSASSNQIELEGPVPISLEKAIEIALEKNPVIHILGQEIESARAQTLISSAFPQAEAEINLEGFGLSDNSRKTEAEYSFGVVQPLPFPGKLKLQSEIGQTYESESRLNLEKEKIILASEVKKAYYHCLLNQKNEELLKTNQGLLEEIEKNAISLYALGKVPYTDLIRLRIEIARTKNDLFEAEKNLSASFYQLNLLLGLEKGTQLELTSPLKYQPYPEEINNLIEKARSTSPTLKLAALQRDRSELLLKLAKKNFWPDFSLGFFSPSHRFAAVGFTFNINYFLFSRKKINGEKLLAEVEINKAILTKEAIEKFYESRKKQALDQVLQAEKQVRIFEENLLKETEEVMKKALNDYRLGQIDSMNLLDLYRNATQVKLEYYRALYYYLSSVADLEKAGEDYE